MFSFIHVMGWVLEGKGGESEYEERKRWKEGEKGDWVRRGVLHRRWKREKGNTCLRRTSLRDIQPYIQDNAAFGQATTPMFL